MQIFGLHCVTFICIYRLIRVQLHACATRFDGSANGALCLTGKRPSPNILNNPRRHISRRCSFKEFKWNGVPEFANAALCPRSSVQRGPLTFPKIHSRDLTCKARITGHKMAVPRRRCKSSRSRDYLAKKLPDIVKRCILRHATRRQFPKSDIVTETSPDCCLWALIQQKHWNKRVMCAFCWSAWKEIGTETGK